MEHEICIKNHKFGTGRPILCAPVVEETEGRILASIQNMANQGVEMIEWRMDWYRNGSDPEAVASLLKKLAPVIKQTVFLGTFRSKRQGGQQDISVDDYLELNLQAAKTGVLDLVDVEFFQIKAPKDIVYTLQQAGVRVVASDHDFAETPEGEIMRNKLKQMYLSRADFIKLAVMPQEKADVLRLMEEILSVKKEFPMSHIIAISMGSDGVISRLLGQWFHSEVTFAAFEKTSAPGQVSYEEAHLILEHMEGWMKE